MSAKTRRVLEYILEHREKTGHCPTKREVLDAMGIKTMRALEAHLRRLEASGDIALDGVFGRRIAIPRKPAAPTEAAATS